MLSLAQSGAGRVLRWCVKSEIKCKQIATHENVLIANKRSFQCVEKFFTPEGGEANFVMRVMK